MRHALLSVAIVMLIMSAGCSSFLTDGNPAAAGTEQSPATSTLTPTNNTSSVSGMPSDGTDLRNVTIPENDTDRNTYTGEIDAGDSVLEGTNRYYEPVQFTAEAGDKINVSLSSIANDPELQLRNPNGSTIATDDDGGDGNDARITRFELNQTGQYTLVAAAAEPNTSFTYTLAVERYVEPNFQGPMSSWDEQSRYLEFADDYRLVAQNLSGGPDEPSDAETIDEIEGNLTAGTYTVNTQEDYIIVRYYMDANSTPMERISIDASLQDAYYGLYEAYIDSDGAENASWVPERIYHVAYDYDGNLYRTSYLDREWAVAYSEAGGSGNYSARATYNSLYFSTFRQGPAHQNYTEGGEYATTLEEAPVGTYENTSINATD